MKLFTSITSALAVAAAVALAPSAKAQIGTTTNSSSLNISLVVITNGNSFLKAGTSATYIYPTNFAKLGNKQLLKIIAGWAGTNFPSGSKLVVGWDWDGDPLVVDKTGTNVLYDAYSGSSAYLYVDFNDEDGAYKENYIDASPGTDEWTEWYAADVQLYDDYVYLSYTDASIYGGNKGYFKQAWDANGNYTHWTADENLNIPMQGIYYFNDVGSYEASMKADVTSSGSGKGENTYWY